jgi:hypothetical protein
LYAAKRFALQDDPGNSNEGSMNKKPFFIALCAALGAAIGYSVDLSSDSSPGAWFVVFATIGLTLGLIFGTRWKWK